MRRSQRSAGKRGNEEIPGILEASPSPTYCVAYRSIRLTNVATLNVEVAVNVVIREMPVADHWERALAQG